MNQTSDPYQVLKDEDIREKVELNLKAGRSIEDIRNSLIREMQDLIRARLRHENQISAINIQIQNLAEQIAYIDRTHHPESVLRALAKEIAEKAVKNLLGDLDGS